MANGEEIVSIIICSDQSDNEKQSDHEQNDCEVSENSESLGTCLTCSKHMFFGDTCWVRDRDAPFFYTLHGPCLCQECYCAENQNLRQFETVLEKSAKKYPELSQEIFCCFHWVDPRDKYSYVECDTESGQSVTKYYVSTDECDSECTCCCAVCGRSGSRGRENEWYCAESNKINDKSNGFGEKNKSEFFWFLLCPDCVPNSVQDTGMRLNGEFAGKWFYPHLEKVVLTEYVE